MTHLYVSASAPNNRDGSASFPYASVNEALEALRKRNVKEEVLITVESGIYPMSESVHITESDTGITIEGEGDVLFEGGAVFPLSASGRTADRRFPDPSIVRTLDLKNFGFENTAFANSENSPRFYAGNRVCRPARYPNISGVPGQHGSYVFSPHTVCSNESSSVTVFPEGNDFKAHMSRWSDNSLKDAMGRGYLWCQWSRFTLPVESIDRDSCSVTFRGLGTYAKTGEHTDGKQRRIYFSNIPEELDDPGEYWFDRSSETLYFIPDAGLTDNDTAAVSVCTEPAFVIDGAKNITVRNIRVRHYRSEAFRVKNSENVSIEHCEIAQNSGRGAIVTAGKKVVFDSCVFFDLTDGCTLFENCGIRQTLTQAESGCVNCYFRDFNEVETCYRPALETRTCCGIFFRKCTVENCPHNALNFWATNDAVIEDSRFINCCRDCDDASAIYWGRDPSETGIIIRGNYFENIGCELATYSTASIYIDDYAAGGLVEDNVFFNSGILDYNETKPSIHSNAQSVVLNSVQFFKGVNNITICANPDQKPVNLYPACTLPRWVSYCHDLLESPTGGKNSGWYEKLADAGFFSDEWKEHYRGTQWAQMYDFVNPENHKALEREIDERTADESEDCRSKIILDSVNRIYDMLWDHKTEEGEDYKGSFRDFYLEKYPETDPKVFEGDPFQVIFMNHVWYHFNIATTNEYRGNLCIGMSRDYLDENGNLRGKTMNGFSENLILADDMLPDGTSIFRDSAAHDFTLTEEGLLYVRRNLPNFRLVKMAPGASVKG